MKEYNSPSLILLAITPHDVITASGGLNEAYVEKAEQLDSFDYQW